MLMQRTSLKKNSGEIRKITSTKKRNESEERKEARGDLRSEKLNVEIG